MAKKAVLSRS